MIFGAEACQVAPDIPEVGLGKERGKGALGRLCSFKTDGDRLSDRLDLSTPKLGERRVSSPVPAPALPESPLNGHTTGHRAHRSSGRARPAGEDVRPTAGTETPARPSSPRPGSEGTPV